MSKKKIDNSIKSLLILFKDSISRAFPGFVEQVILFGSESRGNAHESSDIDVLVITTHDDWRMGDEIRRIGYELDLFVNSRLSIQVLSRSHIRMLQHNDFLFIKNVQRDGITV